MRNGMSLSPTEFREKLEKSGLTEESYRNKLKSQILQSRLLSYDVRSKIIVTDEMILDYYNENYKSRVDKGGYYLLQMGFSWPKTDDPEKFQPPNKKPGTGPRGYTTWPKMARISNHWPKNFPTCLRQAMVVISVFSL